jgi:peptidoglycan/xylan/chitin deacetylase (PgdA/CDA1 family)
LKKLITLLKNIYRQGSPGQKVLADRLRFQIGMLPRVTQGVIGRDWLPNPYRAALVISADFELGWAYRYARPIADTQRQIRQVAEQTRRNLPALLEIFDRYETPITWATVGHLFLDSCRRLEGKAHPNLPRPPYFENEWWVYQVGDWYDADPCTSLADAPEWYAPDLIRNILAAKVKHEIGCHTFSHIDCSEGVCSPELLRAELTACQQLAAEWGIELKSFVFPANFKGNLPILKEYGFEGYRLDTICHIGIPVLDEVGLCAIPGGIFWEIPPGWKVMEYERTIQRCVELALEKNLVLHLWFHPSCNEVNINQTFPAFLEYIKTKRSEIWVVTMRELADFFLHKEITGITSDR